MTSARQESIDTLDDWRHMMDLGALLRIVSSANLDPESRQALLHAARGERGEEVEAAIETLALALGVIDDDGDVNENKIRELTDDVGLEMDHQIEDPGT
jgi:hypothetical protein